MGSPRTVSEETSQRIWWKNSVKEYGTLENIQSLQKKAVKED